MSDNKRDELLDWLDRCVQYATGIETTARGKISEAGFVLVTEDAILVRVGRAADRAAKDQRTKDAEIVRELRDQIYSQAQYGGPSLVISHELRQLVEDAIEAIEAQTSEDEA